jgi:UDP-glucose 4-epimerase
MKILVIGSKGFIGSHVAYLFSAAYGYDVHECDVVVDYGKSNYYLIDATNADYHQIFRQTLFDVCVNCAGAASVSDSILNPLRDYTLNTYNVFKILDAIRIYQPGCRFINLSSAAVYGNPSRLPVPEALDLVPVSPYGAHKLQAEMIGEEFFQYYNVPNCSLRIFSAYGPRLKKQLLWDIFQKANQSDKIELFGSGQESRDLIYIDDLIAAIQCCMVNAKFTGEAINIANGNETTISNIVNTFLSFFLRKKQVYFNGKVKEGDPLNWKADISLLKLFGYTPSIDLHHGLEKYFSWVSKL